jgi:signal transduction histidine kinase
MAIFILSLTALATIISTRLLLAGSLSMEKDLVREAIEGGQHFLASEEKKLSSIAKDWANWDDAYRFMSDTNQSFVDVNLVDNTFRSLRLNLIAFFDAQGRPACVQSFNLESDSQTQPPSQLMTALMHSPGMTVKSNATQSVGGLLMVGNSVWLLSSEPILTSEAEGPVRGTLIMGRRLNNMSDWCSSRHWHGLFTLRAAPPGLRPDALEINTRSLGTITGRAALRDLAGRPALLLETTLARRILARGLVGEFFMTGWILLSGALIGLFAFWLVDRWVLRSLSYSIEALKQGMSAVTARANLKHRLKIMQNGEMRELAVCLNDMLTALDRAHQESEARRRELIQAQKMTALGTLVAGVAHEVNNPTTVINLNLSALLRRVDKAFAPDAPPGDGAKLKDEMRTLIAETRDATLRIATIAASLKAFARPSSEKMNMLIDINALIGKTCGLLKQYLAKSHCDVKLMLADPSPLTWGNEPQLVQVLLNLLENACQACPNPGSTIEIASENGSDGTARVTVRDHGSGILPENLDRIFEPFYTTRRDQGGTGLGLSISLEIIRSHAGQITVQSTPGEGSTFTLTLPAHTEKEPHDSRAG